jgi:hypothetical protein
MSVLHKVHTFICSLFNDAVSSSDYVVPYDKMMMNYELETVWEEVVVVWSVHFVARH